MKHINTLREQNVEIMLKQVVHIKPLGFKRLILITSSRTNFVGNVSHSLDIYTHYSLQYSFAELLVDSPVSPGIYINSTSCFGHIGPSSGIFVYLHKFLCCVVVLYSH
jgi:hypothetical protein